MSTSWTTPRDGAGTWRHTPAHPKLINTVTDLLVAFLACLIVLTLFAGLYVAGKHAMCAVYDGSLSYCPGYVAADR